MCHTTVDLPDIAVCICTVYVVRSDK